MYWDQLTSAQLDRLDRKIPVILPMAATEQHGPHLPLATDRLIGEHFCRELNERMPESILILPSISIGCSDHHMDFVGSLSLSHATFQSQAQDVLDSVMAHGFDRLVLLNSHGGNQGVGQVVMESVGFENPDIRVVFTSWWRTVDWTAAGLEPEPGDAGHAGEFETSLMLVIAPELVDTESIQPKANIPTFDWAEGDLIRSGKAGLYRRMTGLTSNGAFGDPGKASAEKGQMITALVVDALVRILTDLRNA